MLRPEPGPAPRHPPAAVSPLTPRPSVPSRQGLENGNHWWSCSGFQGSWMCTTSLLWVASHSFIHSLRRGSGHPRELEPPPYSRQWCVLPWSRGCGLDRLPSDWTWRESSARLSLSGLQSPGAGCPGPPPPTALVCGLGGGLSSREHLPAPPGELGAAWTVQRSPHPSARPGLAGTVSSVSLLLHLRRCPSDSCWVSCCTPAPSQPLERVPHIPRLLPVLCPHLLFLGTRPLLLAPTLRAQAATCAISSRRSLPPCQHGGCALAACRYPGGLGGSGVPCVGVPTAILTSFTQLVMKQV